MFLPDILILYYLVAKTGGLLLAFTTAYGLYSHSHSAFQVFCLVFTGHFFGSLVFLRVFLGNEKRLRWFYDHVGERRVKYILFGISFVANSKNPERDFCKNTHADRRHE